MVALLYLLAIDPDPEASRKAAVWLRDVMTSWPAQGLIVALYVGLAVLAFTRVTRDWEDGSRKRYFRAAVVALGVFFILEFVLGSALLSVVIWPTWVYLVEMIWLFGMWLYYFVRFMTRQRSGPGDDESRRRGAALEQVIAPLSDEAHRTKGA